jgi:hypothetical protein
LATRSSLAYFVIQLAGFVTVTGLMLAGGVVPYRPGVVSSERLRLFVSGLEIIWWLGAAWLTVGFLRASFRRTQVVLFDASNSRLPWARKKSCFENFSWDGFAE